MMALGPSQAPVLHEAEQEAHEQQAEKTQVLPEGLQARFQRQDKGDSGQGQQQGSPIPQVRAGQQDRQGRQDSGQQINQGVKLRPGEDQQQEAKAGQPDAEGASSRQWVLRLSTRRGNGDVRNQGQQPGLLDGPGDPPLVAGAIP